MTNEIHNPNEPAFPCDSDIHGRAFRGLTKRQYIATQLAGIFIQQKGLSTFEAVRNTEGVTDDVIDASFALADKIINYDK